MRTWKVKFCQNWSLKWLSSTKRIKKTMTKLNFWSYLSAFLKTMTWPSEIISQTICFSSTGHHKGSRSYQSATTSAKTALKRRKEPTFRVQSTFASSVGSNIAITALASLQSTATQKCNASLKSNQVFPSSRINLCKISRSITFPSTLTCLLPPSPNTKLFSLFKNAPWISKITRKFWRA